MYNHGLLINIRWANIWINRQTLSFSLLHSNMGCLGCLGRTPAHLTCPTSIAWPIYMMCSMPTRLSFLLWACACSVTLSWCAHQTRLITSRGAPTCRIKPKVVLSCLHRMCSPPKLVNTGARRTSVCQLQLGRTSIQLRDLTSFPTLNKVFILKNTIIIKSSQSVASSNNTVHATQLC